MVDIRLGLVSCASVGTYHGSTVVAIFWARVLCGLAAEKAGFRMRITLGVIPIRSLACSKYVA